MKQTKHLNKALLSIITTLGLGGAITGATILANTSTNVDKLELLTRAVQNDTVQQLQSKRGDIAVELGWNHSAAIINGALYTWGLNGSGQLGLGDTNNRTIPTQVTSTASGTIMDHTVTQIALGYNYSAAIIDHALYTWGTNNYGQLGLGDWNNRNIPTQVTNTSNGAIKPGTVNQIVLGGNHSATIIDGALYTWGRNHEGQLGLGDTNYRNIPRQVERTSNSSITPWAVTQIALGEYYSAAVIDGALYTWGSNSDAQLGLGDTNQRNIPTQVKNTTNGSITQNTVTQIALGRSHSAAVIGGALYTWGKNDYGQLGLGDTNYRNIPRQVERTSNSSIISGTVAQISLGRDYSAAIIGGALYTWGYNNIGQLGLGDTNLRTIPTQVKNTTNGSITQNTVTQIALESTHSAAVINGALYTWGENSSGQLGLGNSGSGTDRNIPTHLAQIETTQKDIITLNPTIDIANIRDKIVYNVTTNDILAIFNQNPLIIPGLSSSSAISNITFKAKIGTTSIGGNNVGQIIVTFTANSKKFETTFNGFRPVNETQNITIAQKSLPVNETSFANDEINQLVANANADTTGRNNKLATWIINNSSLIIGNTANEYTQDFPRNARITKVSDVRVVNGITATLSFKIDVDKYYKPSTPATNLIESTSSDTNITLTNPITLSGFRTTNESTITQIKTSNADINATDLLTSFDYLSPSISSSALIELKKYVDLSTFPNNTAFSIKNAIIDPITKTKVSFQIAANQYFNTNGILVTSPLTFNDVFTINNLKNAKSNAFVVADYDKWPAQFILDHMQYVNENTIINKVALQKFIDISSFPTNTTFKIKNLNTNIPNELTFEIEASSWKDIDGSIKTTPTNFGPFRLDNLSTNPTTVIKIKLSYNTNILTGDLLKYFEWTNNNTPGNFNKARVQEYVDFGIEPISPYPAPNYIMKDLRQSGNQVTFVINTDSYYVNGTNVTTPKDFHITIAGLGAVADSINASFEKYNITDPGNIIAAQISANIVTGDIIDSNNPTKWQLWNKLVDVNIYPVNTIFGIDRITANHHGGVFSTFEIQVTASKYYENNTTMNVPAPVRTVNITRLKFTPTSLWLNNIIPNIDAHQFFSNIDYNQNGSFNPDKLQEFITLNNFDLTNPGTTTKLVNPTIVDNQISFGLEVTNYVDANGIGKSENKVYTISFNINTSDVPGSSDSTNGDNNDSINTIILAAGIGGGILLLLIILVIIIMRRRSYEWL